MALPRENPTLRTTWLKLMALEVSLWGVTARMTPGMAAEKLPTPKPSTPMATNSSARLDRAAAKRANAPRTTTALPAKSNGPPIRSRMRGVSLPAANPRAENGTRTRPATKVVSPKP